MFCDTVRLIYAKQLCAMNELQTAIVSVPLYASASDAGSSTVCQLDVIYVCCLNASQQNTSQSPSYCVSFDA